MRTLAARRKAAPEGSYTKRLFDDPVLLKAKLLEEVQNLRVQFASWSFR